MSIPKILKPKQNTRLKRFGRNNDGGYLVTQKSVINSNSLLSLGILDDVSFESDFIKLNNVDVHCFDHTVGKNFWKRRLYNDFGAGIYNLNFQFIINSFNRYFEFKKFFSKKSNILNIETIKNGSLTEILNSNKLQQPLFLKIDIDGSEYRILEELVELQNHFSALIIEFHDVDLNLKKISDFIEKFKLILTHIHPNNYGFLSHDNLPTVIECTFEREPEFIAGEVILPNKLDQPNDPSKKDHNLIFNIK